MAYKFTDDNFKEEVLESEIRVKGEKMEKIYASPVKNSLQRNGFVMVSNLLIDSQQELGITELELSPDLTLYFLF